MAIVYQLITADGVTFNLSGIFADGGYSVSSPPYVPDGVGFPPIKHITQDIYNMPGSLLQDIQVRPRIVDLPMQTWGNDVGAMLDARSRLINVLRWDRSLGSPPDPATLRVTVDGVAADLLVYYLSDITSTNRRAPGGLTTMGIRLIAYDPLWRSTTTSVQSCSIRLRATTSFFTSLELPNFVFDPDCTPSSGATVYAIAVDPDTGIVAIGGIFENWDGDANDDWVVLYNGSDFSTLAPTDARLSGQVYALAYAADSILYLGGQFNNAGGDADADNLCKVSPYATDPIFQAVGGPINGAVYAIHVARDGTIYIGGGFADADGEANTLRIAKWDGTDWTAMGTGAADNIVYAIKEAPDGSIYAVGTFSAMGGVADTDCIARWDGTAWHSVGANFDSATEFIYALVFADNGDLYVAGDIPTVNYILRWNGSAWYELGDGLTGGIVRCMDWFDGMLYVAGHFTQAGSITPTEGIARWTGESWVAMPVSLESPTILAIAHDDEHIYLGHNGDAIRTFVGATDLTYDGSVAEYPIISAVGAMTLTALMNDVASKEILASMSLSAGEIVTFDLTPGVKTVEGATTGNRLGDIAPTGDLNTFSLVPAPVAALGVNEIAILVDDPVVTETGDNNNQITVIVGQITGLTLENTDKGRLYVSIIDDGGGFFHIGIYEDPARSELVAHTATYNGGGAEALVADNTSELGGTITVDAVVAADADIVLMPPFVQFEYYGKFWSLEDAVK